MLDTPILFLIFNRPDLTKQVFGSIREARPSKLFIAADGARRDRQVEVVLCEETRNFVLQRIDWPCEVKTLFRERNLGCRIAVSEAITWFFEQVEEGIILEDDTLPNTSFFQYTRQLLKEFRNDDKIFHISGNNFQMSAIGDGDYYLSKIPHVWGWATWRRAWLKFNISVSSFNQTETISWFGDAEIDLYWNKIFSRIKNMSVDEWAYLWVYTLFNNNGYAIQPQYNLVKNIGFDERSLRTSSPKDYLSDLKTYEINNIVHPSELHYDKAFDINFQKFFNWYSPIYQNRMSGTTALKTLLQISRRKIFGN